MSKKNANPYRDGSAYSKIFDNLRKANQAGVTRAGLLEAGYSVSDITVILSPREEGKCRGDCRGNMSAAGHLYFVTSKVKDGEKRFVLRWRKKDLEPSKRQVKAKVSQKKTKVEEVKADIGVTADTGVTA